jgi:hypothetical protein
VGRAYFLPMERAILPCLSYSETLRNKTGNRMRQAPRTQVAGLQLSATVSACKGRFVDCFARNLSLSTVRQAPGCFGESPWVCLIPNPFSVVLRMRIANLFRKDWHAGVGTKVGELLLVEVACVLATMTISSPSKR